MINKAGEDQGWAGLSQETASSAVYAICGNSRQPASNIFGVSNNHLLYSSPLGFTFPHIYLVFSDTVSAPCWILLQPFSPSSLVLVPSHEAFSLAAYRISAGFISQKGMLSEAIFRPYSMVGCSPQALPPNIFLQYAEALEAQISLIQALRSSQCLRQAAKRQLPPRQRRQTSAGVQGSMLMLLTLVAQANCLNSAAQLRQRQMAWLSQTHCRLALPQQRQWPLLSISTSFSRVLAGAVSWIYIPLIIISALNYPHLTSYKIKLPFPLGFAQSTRPLIHLQPTPTHSPSLLPTHSPSLLQQQLSVPSQQTAKSPLTIRKGPSCRSAY